MLARQRPRNRQHRRRASKKPRDGDLAGRRSVPLGDSGQLSASGPAQRIERNENDSFGGAVVDDRLVLALREVVLVLHRDDGRHFASALDLVDTDVRYADVPDLALVLVLLDRRKALLQRCLRVDAVQVVESDPVGPQAAKALLDLAMQNFRASTPRAAEAAFGGHDDAVGGGGNSLPERF